MRIFPQSVLLLSFLAVFFSLAETGRSAQPSVEHAHSLCANCHIQKPDPCGNPTTLEASRPKECVECHSEALQPRDSQSTAGYAHSRHGTEQKTAPLGGKSFNRLDCLTCHVPHFQGQPKLLRLNNTAVKVSGGIPLDSATQLCLYCHPLAGEFKTSGRRYVRHPVGIPVLRAGRLVDRSQLPPLVDVKGTQDPSDDVIGCTTCHYVHGSKNPFLLRWGLAELSAACLKCHTEVAPSEPGDLKGLMARR